MKHLLKRPNASLRRKRAKVDGEFIELGKLKQPSGKIVHAWALEGNIDASQITSNTFTLEWPRNSGRIQEYPEVEKGDWFDLETARKKMHKGQVRFLDKLMASLNL